VSTSSIERIARKWNSKAEDRKILVSKPFSSHFANVEEPKKL